VGRPDLGGLTELGQVGIAELKLVGRSLHGKSHRLDRLDVFVMNVTRHEHLGALRHIVTFHWVVAADSSRLVE